MKILIAEDDMTSRLVLGATLKKLGHEVTAIADGQQAWDALQKEHFPLLISDWMMPDMNGLELCRLIRAENQAPYTYIILLTSLEGKACYLDGMDAGADDFITKPFDEDQLVARLRVADRILVLHEKLRAQAMYDELTQLANRRAFNQQLKTETERAQRYQTPLSLLLLDIDKFKLINDTWGHSYGDEVLQGVAVLLQTGLRSTDLAARYGGEEMVVILPNTAAEGALCMAERCRELIEAGTWPQGKVTASFGASTYRSGMESTAFIAAADAALYYSKKEGRNRSTHIDSLTNE